jgi:hypothetical protein
VHAFARYTIEVSRPGGGWTDLQQACAGARRAAQQMRKEGTPVRFLRSIFLPEDETCFFLFEAPTEAAVRDAAARAGLGFKLVRKTIKGEDE